MRFYRKRKRLFAMQIYKENKAKNRKFTYGGNFTFTNTYNKKFLAPLYFFCSCKK